MPENIPVTQPNPAVPVPSKDDPIIVPPEPSPPIEINEPPQSAPVFPIREPGVQSPQRVVKSNVNGGNVLS